jgi:hypothetical protein
MLVEIPFYQCVSLSHTNDLLSGYMFIRKDVVFQVVSDLRDPCIGTSLSIWILHARFMKSPVMPMILVGLQINRAAGTIRFEVLVSPPSPSSVGRAVGRCSHRSKTLSGTRAHVDAFVDSSSATALLARGICCRSKTSNSFLASMHGAGRNPTVDHCSCIHP